MPRWETAGEVRRFGNGFEWRVEDQYFMPYCRDTYIASPLFNYANSLWYLTKQPDDNGNWFGLGLCGTSSQCAVLLFKLSIFNRSGTVKRCEGRTGPFGRFEEIKFMKYSEFAKRRTEIAPGGYVRFFFEVFCVKGSEPAPSTASADGTLRSENGRKNDGKIHRYVQTYDLPSFKGTSKLQQDLKNLLLTEEDSDVTIKVQYEEFLAHEIILRARCPVFYAVFKNKMEEQTSGVVLIDDCDPGCFRHFLSYIYTGIVEDLTAEDVLPLYIVADKYCLDDLKSQCVEYIKATLSTETFCSAMTLSLRYSEAELLELVSVFFAKNMSEILLTEEWEVFLHENTAAGNEMLAKAVIMSKKHNT